MIRLDNNRDTKDSHAPRFVALGSYDSLHVEASCREIFNIFIDRCKSVFRGSPQSNKTMKPSRGLDANTNVCCVERVQNSGGALT
jgi:hypothetical protein